MKGGKFGGRQSLLPLFEALTILSLQVDLPKDFDKIQTVNIYEANRIKEGKDFDELQTVNIYEANGINEGNWEHDLEVQGHPWIITPLHYANGGSYVRIASESLRWNNKSTKLKKHEHTSWFERKYALVQRQNTQQDKKERAGDQKYTMFESKPDESKAKTETSLQERKYNLPKAQSTDKQRASNEGDELEKYTMLEYTPDEGKPTHALCRITKNNVHDKPLSNSQKRKVKEIDHTDRNNGDKGKTSPSHKSVQQGYYNQQVLEAKLRELIGLGFSEEHILEAFRRIKSEKIPAPTFEHAPGPSTSNWRTTEPENMDLMKNMDLINNMDLLYYEDIMDLINNDRDLSDTTDWNRV